MDNLVINPKTRSLIMAALKSPAHAYLFVGKKGLGKTSTAMLFAKSVMGDSLNSADRERWLRVVEPIENKKISIAQIKSAREFCNLTAGERVQNKVVIIDEAELLSTEASNCLLSILEEPPANTVFILISHSKLSIPKTILSRTQIINFYLPNKEQMHELAEKYDIPSSAQELPIFSPAKLISLSTDSEEINRLYERANGFIEGGLNERLMIISTLHEKHETANLIDAIAIILQSDNSQLDWRHDAESLILAQSHLYNNGNARLVMENLALEFK
jgi:DNA polymerase III delta prime subunit